MSQSQTIPVGQRTRRCCPASSLLATLFCIALVWFCFHLYTTHNDFPLRWHPDEPSKIEQLLSNTRNYLHPELLLEVTEIVRRIAHTPAEPEATVQIGRAVSAAFASIALATLALLAFFRRGIIAMIAVGLAVGLCPTILVYAHYLKEDTALLMGIAFVFLAAHFFLESQSTRGQKISLAFLGVTCGIAMSAKYIGIVTIPIALIALHWRRNDLAVPPKRRLPQLLLPLLSVLLIINWRVFLDPLLFFSHLAFEMRHPVTKHQGLTMSIPNAWFIVNFFQEVLPVALVLCGLYLIALFRGNLQFAICNLQSQKLSNLKSKIQNLKFDLLLPAFTLAWLLLVSFDILPQTRYLLPSIMLTYMMAGLAAVELPRLLMKSKSSQALLTLILIAMIPAFLLPRDRNYLDQFANDSRAALQHWLEENVPKGGIIAAEDYAGLVPQGEHDSIVNGIRILSDKHLADVGSLDCLAADGVQYVVVCDLQYDRYFSHFQKPTKRGTAEYNERRKWYQDLFKNYPLVWQSPKHIPMNAYTNPTLRVFKLTQH